jgi:hypothetical protein
MEKLQKIILLPYLKKRCWVVTYLLLCLCAFTCCKEDFTTDGSKRLSYSADTVKFDTVFSDVLTPTRKIMVYNQTEENIRIEECALQNNSECFQINVNGRSGTAFQNIEIEAGDSLHLFVQLLIPEGEKEKPLLIEDFISFSYNGNQDRVILSAYGQDVVRLPQDSILSDTVWSANKPFLIYNNLVVAEGATLTIEAGTKIFLHDNAHIIVNGTILCNGEQGSPIVFRGDRSDNITSTTSYDQLDNQWGGIHITKSSLGNVIKHTNIRNGNFGIRIDSATIDPTTPRLIIGNSQIHNVNQSALRAKNANVYAYNSLFTCAGNGCVVLEGGEYLFNHCTVADYTRGAGQYAFAVVLADKELYSDGSQLFPLLALFNNCLIYGPIKNELYFEYEELTDNYNFHFNHCLIKYDGYQEEVLYEKYFNQPLWNELPHFKEVNITERKYDFHIDSLSAAKYKGDKAVLALYPECLTDKDGQTRENDSLPDIGAYQWVQTIVEEEEEEEENANP